MVKRPVLTEDDAWDIALAWRDQLRGCVRLKTVAERIPSSIIPRFEWVKFVFHGIPYSGCQDITDRPQAAAYARAATIAWFALSCCEGYSGVENPQFWKRVFQELLYPKDLPSFKDRSAYPSPEQLPITDAVRFFDHPDRPFPRINVPNGSSQEKDVGVVSVFLGILPYEDVERDATLRHILATLQPFMRKSDAMRSVPVEHDQWRLTPKHAELLRNIPRRGERGSRGTVSVASMIEFPQLYLRSLNLLEDRTYDIQSLYSLMPPSDVQVPLGGRLPSFVQDHQLWRVLLDQLQDDSSSAEKHRCWRVTHVNVMKNADLSYSLLSVMCSALPYLQSVESVKLPTHRYFNGTSLLISSDWTWLGYAIFHPDAASRSGLRSLKVDLNGITPAHIAALTRMAVGNNVLGEENTGYLEGRIRSGTKVSAQEAQGDDPALYTFASEAWVALNVSSPQAFDRQDLVCVVIPGFGCGWIHRDSVIETRTRRAGESCIRALRVNNYTEDPMEDMNKEALLGLLGVLGSRLTILHFKNSNHMSASAVRAILSLCPSLKSLHIHHDGSFWADDALAMETPRLEELELTVHGRYSPVRQSVYLLEVENYHRHGGPRPREPWATGPRRPLQELKPSCLPYLKALHVTSARDGAYAQHEPILLSFLAQQPVLQYLHWSRGYEPSRTWADAPAYRANENTREFLAQLRAEHHLSLGPLHLDCRLAFLSVIDEKAAQSISVGRLAADFIALIFQYSSSPVRREIFINRYAGVRRR